jgi:predicted DCC family thiol-disulfide oxidoreductase YuxK
LAKRRNRDEIIMTPHPQHIVFFDGVCNFCNGVVNILFDYDKHRKLMFASLQGETYQELRNTTSELSADLPADVSSIVVVSEGRIYLRSAAALRIAWLLGGVWRLLVVFWLVPTFVRDAAYSVIARNRYRWFGKTDSCRIPAPHEQGRFLP